jgi:hypothetical protein
MSPAIKTTLRCLIALSSLLGCSFPEGTLTVSETPPAIYPDYTDVTIPYNIAPLNFMLTDRPAAVAITLRGVSKKIRIRGGYNVHFPLRTWKALLQAEKGNDLVVEVKARFGKDWVQYAPFRWRVAPEAIDPYLSYRLIEPGYEVWNAIQLVERNIETFGERVIADNNLTGGACMNCHIYGAQNPNLSFFHLRGEKGGTVLNRNGRLRKINARSAGMASPAVYGGLHPSGRYGVFSTNRIIPAFHTLGSERLEVYDAESDLVIIDFDANQSIPFPPAADSAAAKPFRTFPVFSADGNAVYYCQAPFVTLPGEIHKLMYSLCRISFDTLTRAFGSRVDTLFSAADAGWSVSYPKPSPDGRYLMYALSACGTFPIWHRETDLQMIDLHTGETVDLSEANGRCSDSWHSWSSNGRWFVFAGKRDDGLYGKPYFSYINPWGTACKPFVLPQRDPAFYYYTLTSFNIPELSKGKLPFDAADVERLYRDVSAETITQLTPSAP